LFKEGFKCGRIDAYLSVFFMTGSNLSGSESGMQELKRWRSTMPLFIRLLHYLLRGMRYFEKWVIGGYREKFPFQYSIYTSGNLQQRKDRLAESGTARFVSWSRK
ncbi:MAG: hypothetical protein OEL75_00945, partial [Kiritimatiellaceae bacterium]|nr:hypothetical protein [Kiritimatiellaceae bacterium]